VIINPAKVLFPVLILVLSQGLCVSPAFGSSGYKCKKPACDINAIGHRKFFKTPTVGNWYSTEKEKELGAKYAAALEQRVELLEDPGIVAYVDQVAQRIARNSDADMPITVRIIRENSTRALTLFGGHLYVTTGLLLKLESEGELASVLARGIAHTALRSVARLQTRSALLQAMSVPMIGTNNPANAPGANDYSAMLGSLKFQRDFELEADYFGIQYMYKAGYDADCFIQAIQNIWQKAPSTTLAKAFSPFPPVADRLKVIRKEIHEILPNRPVQVVSTPQFDEFIAHLRADRADATFRARCNTQTNPARSRAKRIGASVELRAGSPQPRADLNDCGDGALRHSPLRESRIHARSRTPRARTGWSCGRSGTRADGL